MHINLSTPLSDDKEMQRRNEVILAAIEQYTEERMNDEYGRIHTDGSRSGGQPVVKTQHCPNCEAQAAEIERLRAEAQAQFDRGYYDGCANPIVRCDALREALRFYAREANYRSTTVYMSGQSGKTAVEIDGGQRARAALDQGK